VNIKHFHEVNESTTLNYKVGVVVLTLILVLTLVWHSFFLNMSIMCAMTPAASSDNHSWCTCHSFTKKRFKEKFTGVIMHQLIQHRPDALWFNYSKMSKDLQTPTNLFNELEVLHVKN
jgi:hypothetical protein